MQSRPCSLLGKSDRQNILFGKKNEQNERDAQALRRNLLRRKEKSDKDRTNIEEGSYIPRPDQR